METVNFLVNENIPVVADVDVLVIGGGPGGLGAAVMAARSGAKTMLVERYGILGGMASYGEISPFMWNHFVPEEGQDALTLDKPVYPEWIKTMAKYLPAELLEKNNGIDNEVVSGFSHMISKDLAAIAAEDLCLESGVAILYHHNLVKSVVKDGKIEYAVFATKSGFVAIKAKAFVDSTGDADLTVLSGGKYEIGGPTGHCQPMTLCFKLCKVDWSRFPKNLQELYEKAKADGKLHCPRENVLAFHHYDDDVVHFNTTRVIHKSAVNAKELSEAELEGHKQFREYYRWLRAEVPGFEKAEVRSIASHIGVRESRRIVGIARIGRDDFMNRAKFPDAICRCNYSIDIHAPDGAGTELIHMSNREYYEIPYGCIVPEGISNLTVGARSISVDHALHSSMRVMPPVCSIGQAAGIAAAMAAKTGKSCAELDGCEVRAALVASGAYL